MKKILYVNAASNNLGGIEIYIMNVFRNLDRNKYEAFFLVDNDVIPKMYDEICDNIIYITPRYKNYFKYLIELKNIYSKYNFDIIHINLMSLSNFEPIIVGKLFSNAKIILHSHIANISFSLKTKFLHSIGTFLTKNNINYIKVACSNDAGIWMFNKFKNNNFSVLNNGIDVKKYKYNIKARKKIRLELGINENEVLLGNIGRLCEQKNQIFLLKMLIQMDHRYKLLIIGKGELKNDLLLFINENNLTSRVLFLEDIYNVEDYISAMDIFLFPSIYEGLGIVAIEAEANGMNVIVSDKIPKDVCVNENLYMLPLKEEEWIKKINKINYNERVCDLDKLYSVFDVSNTIKKVIEIYEQC